MIQNIFILSIIALVLSCNSPKPATSAVAEKIDTNTCNELVTAKDFSDLDGCTMMLINEQGEKLLLAENIPDYNIQDGMRYKIGYSTLDGMASICMAENKIIKLNCIEVAKDQMTPTNCKPSSNGFDDPFLAKLLKNNNLTRIERFEYQSTWVYKVKDDSKTWLYNCEGTMMCGGEALPFSKCFATFRFELTNPKIIFQGEGPKE